MSNSASLGMRAAYARTGRRERSATPVRARPRALAVLGARDREVAVQRLIDDALVAGDEQRAEQFLLCDGDHVSARGVQVRREGELVDQRQVARAGHVEAQRRGARRRADLGAADQDQIAGDEHVQHVVFAELGAEAAGDREIAPRRTAPHARARARPCRRARFRPARRSGRSRARARAPRATCAARPARRPARRCRCRHACFHDRRDVEQLALGARARRLHCEVPHAHATARDQRRPRRHGRASGTRRRQR